MTMLHKLKSRVFLTVLFLLILGFGYWYFIGFKSKALIQEKGSDTSINSIEFLPYFLKAGEKLKSYWETGDYPGIGSKIETCGEFHWEEDLAGKDYLKCNPQVLQCYFSNQIPEAKTFFEIEYNNKKKILHLNSDFPPLENYSRKKRFYKLLNDGTFKVSLSLKSNPSIKHTIILPNNCNEVYLPQLKYAHSQKIFGVEDSRENIDHIKEWENKKTIFVDKYLVTKRDVYEWKVSKGIKNLNKNIFEWYEYSDDLLLTEMKNFCHDKGKQLLSTRVFDAASFYRDLEKPEKMTSLFAWGNRNKGLISPRADFNDLYDDDKELSPRTCDKIPISGCQKKYKTFGEDNVSWMGMHDVMGGVLEALDNQETPYFNVKASSYYFDKYSPWHILSHRFNWDGRGFDSKNFNFESSLLSGAGDKILEEKIKIGFRCMSGVD